MKFKWYAETKTDLLVAGQDGNQDVAIKNDTLNAIFGVGTLYDISDIFSVYANVNVKYTDKLLR